MTEGGGDELDGKGCEGKGCDREVPVKCPISLMMHGIRLLQARSTLATSPSGSGRKPTHRLAT